jgi:hypothetical protein
MRKTAALLGAGALVATGAALALPAGAADDAQLSVLHGIPASALEAAGIAGGVVDVYVNGTNTIDNFAPGTLAGPLPLPAGTYTVAITAGDAADASAPALGPVDLTLAAGGNYTAVAFLSADSKPSATLFTNDTTAAPAGQGKLTARHVAAAPEVTVDVNGSAIGSFVNASPDPAKGQLGPAALPAGSYDVKILAGGTQVSTTPPTNAVPVTAGVNTIAYAWGTAESLQVAVQTVNLAHSAPSGVPGGESGAAASTVPGWMFAAAGLGLAGAALSSRKLATTRK